MPDKGADFISELIRAATQTARMSNDERAQLLERAAATFGDIVIRSAIPGHRRKTTDRTKQQTTGWRWRG